ncbi:ribosome biogenesis protein tsr1 [Mycena olivaceomarginata]|nr:ribosome biogenesis protein tsr1 [Mycena olivaceomarginata]
MVEAHHHRPTLKQQNKPFKSKHATKSSLKELAKGRVPRESPKSNAGSKIAAQTRLNRRNNAKQAQTLKRNALVSATQDISTRSAVSSLAEALDVATDDCPDHGLWKLSVPYKRMYAALDACKVADYVVFVLSSTVEVDPWGDTLPARPPVAGPARGSSPFSRPTDALDAKSRAGVLNTFVPSQARVFDMHTAADRLNALRALAEGKPTDVRWREGRAWVLGESAEWEDGVLKVTGVVRGAPLSANRLVHLPNYGDFQISKIMSAPVAKAGKMEVEPGVLCEAGDDADSLGADAAPAEPALPDAKQGTTPKVVRRIPKGMSQYQAAWIIDEEEDDGEDGDDKSGGEDEEMGDAGEEEEAEEMQDMPVEEDHEMDRSVAFQDLDNEEEAKQMTSSFPDEIDTPKDIPAQTRFQRFRGMRSFRTSPWDPYENLPRDYARIFQFEDFKRTERGVRRRAEEEAGVVEPGTRVAVYVRGVPQEAAAAAPVVLFALLQHEHKVSVLNFTVQRNTEYDGSVRSKDPLILCVGPRRLRVNPVYSQHTRGGGKGANNVHKFERYLRHGVTSVATTYGPVAFGKQPCLHNWWPRGRSSIRTRRASSQSALVLTTRRADDVHYFKPIQLHTKHGRTGHIRESLGTHGYLKAHFDGPINQMDTVCMSLYKRVFPKWAQLWTEVAAASENQESSAMEE